tara:strand:- start:1520 stop:1834 length:315 start_codon:yes stop_codon:yes gene_type:complete
MLLSANRRRRVRELAREEYLVASRLQLHPEKRPDSVSGVAIRSVAGRIENSREYKSIIGGLLAKFAIALAIRLIEKWIEEALFGCRVPEDYQKGEPGYAKPTSR